MIKSMIKRQLPEIEGNIAVGTVHTFQGAERNVIIFRAFMEVKKDVILLILIKVL